MKSLFALLTFVLVCACETAPVVKVDGGVPMASASSVNAGSGSASGSASASASASGSAGSAGSVGSAGSAGVTSK
jgi:hypothetical protein